MLRIKARIYPSFHVTMGFWRAPTLRPATLRGVMTLEAYRGKMGSPDGYVQSTPTFFIINHGKAYKVVGGVPYSTLKEYLDRLLR